MPVPLSSYCTSAYWPTSIAWKKLSGCPPLNRPRAGGRNKWIWSRSNTIDPSYWTLCATVTSITSSTSRKPPKRTCSVTSSGARSIQRLAETYPTPRKKQEVPVWIYLSSELSLKLHGTQGYHAFPRILRSGGLIEALGPELGGSKDRHPETHDVTLACPGFNDKNDYDRQTPCDQDFLRKFARDTKTDSLHDWFNREVPRCLRSLGLFDPEGLFIGDASYLFVPDNAHYQQSDLLWFDEHNHPVEADQVDLRDKRYQQHRCYKLVSLIHVHRKLDFFFVVAARVVSGRRHECPILYELVEEVVQAVHKGVIKVLIVDRGLLCGEEVGEHKQKTAVANNVPLRANMDLHADAIGLT